MKRVIAIGLLLSMIVAGALSLLASASPDGLESTAEEVGFGTAAEEHAAAGSPLADYAVRGIDGPLSGSLAGIVGVLVVAGLSFALFGMLRRRTGRA